jgi:hypothetical protein
MTEPNPTEQEQAVAIENVSIKSQEHLERWTLRETPYICFVGVDLVRGLPWPEGHKTFQHVVQAYRSHRAVEADDERPAKLWTDPTTKEEKLVPIHKGDQMTIEELAGLVEHVGRLARQTVEHNLRAEEDTARKTNDHATLLLIREGRKVAQSGLEEVDGRVKDLAETLDRLHQDLVAIAEALSD